MLCSCKTYNIVPHVLKSHNKDIKNTQIYTKVLKRFLHRWSEVKKDKQWLEQEKYPTQAEKNKMIDVVVVIGIKFVMENHIHTFIGELFY